MTRKQRLAAVVLLVALALVAAGAALLFWPARPTPYKIAYDQIRLGMTRAEVMALKPDLPPRADGDAPGLRLASLDWEGMVGGVRREVHIANHDDPESDPRLAGSFFANAEGNPVQGDGADDTVITDQGRILAREQNWIGPDDEVVVIFDPAGRVIEKAYYRLDVASPWLLELRDLLEELWPF